MLVRRLERLAKIRQRALDARNHAGMALSFAGPTPFISIRDQGYLDLAAAAEPRSIGGRRDELRARQGQVALARNFLRQPKASAELQLGLEEVGLQPFHRVLVEGPGADRVRIAPGDRGVLARTDS